MRILIWLLLSIPNWICAQVTNADRISLDLTSGGTKEFFIDIYQSESQIKIVYTFCDSTSESVYPIYQEKFLVIVKTNDKDSIIRLQHELDSLWKANSYYRSDSLEFSVGLAQEYSNLLSVMFSSEKCDFINQTPNILTADGYFVSVIIKSSKHFLKTGAHSPKNSSYPLLTKFLTETLRIGFNSSCYSFLEKEVTYIRP